MSNSNYYYKIQLAYEIPFNVLECTNLERVQARENLYDKLCGLVDENRYEKISLKLSLYQLKDTFNYVITYEAFFRSTVGLPMEEWLEADALKEQAKEEMEAYFGALDCEYKQLNIKNLY